MAIPSQIFSCFLPLRPISSPHLLDSYPVVVAEVLSIDVERLNSLILSTPSLHSKLFGFWKKPTVNLLVANQFVKLMTSLLTNQAAKTIALLKSDVAWIKDTLGHLECAALHDHWGKLWAQDAAFTSFLIEKGAIDILLAQFQAAHAAKHSDVAQMMADVVTGAQWENAFVQALVGEKGAVALLDLLDPANSSACRYVPRVISALIRVRHRPDLTSPDLT